MVIIWSELFKPGIGAMFKPAQMYQIFCQTLIERENYVNLQHIFKFPPSGADWF